MITSLTAATVALAIGLPIVALGESLREREERRTDGQSTSSPGRTRHEHL
jgi:hypothetical protein|nr:MAG TPA: hypothetical protein [Caudoviricetes sp.]